MVGHRPRHTAHHRAPRRWGMNSQSVGEVHLVGERIGVIAGPLSSSGVVAALVMGRTPRCVCQAMGGWRSCLQGVGKLGASHVGGQPDGVGRVPSDVRPDLASTSRLRQEERDHRREPGRTHCDLDH